jgi:hypothetical protein
MEPNKYRRALVDGGRRIPVTVTLTAQDHLDLLKIANGNKSAAIERLISAWRAKKLTFADA